MRRAGALYVRWCVFGDDLGNGYASRELALHIQNERMASMYRERGPWDEWSGSTIFALAVTASLGLGWLFMTLVGDRQIVSTSTPPATVGQLTETSDLPP